MRTEMKEKDRHRRIEVFVRLHKDKAKLNAAASLIQQKICAKIKIRG